jgi:transcriptional regulator with XRE-family HTH domain
MAGHIMTKLEFFRRSQGWSQEDLARRLGPGFTGSSVSLIESGRLRPSARQEARLHVAFGLPIDELLAVASDPGLPKMTLNEAAP